jgi:hypothetical protein
MGSPTVVFVAPQNPRRTGGVTAVNGWAAVPLTFPNRDLFDKASVVHEQVVLCPLLIRPVKTLLLRAKPRVPWKLKPVAYAQCRKSFAAQTLYGLLGSKLV